MSLVARGAPVPVEAMGRVHFVGIGGVGMSGIARVLLQRGIPVSGSDANDGPLLRELEALGAEVHVGHSADHVRAAGADTVVVSSAVRDTNPELEEARRRGLRVLPRAAALGALLLDRCGVAVAGTHGKTTTTSMLVAVLRHLGAEPGYVIGGKLAATGVGADAGAGEVIAVEADESDGSFLLLSPRVAVVTNVEADHLDNYGGLAEIHANFADFARRVERALVVGVDDPGARKVAEAARERGTRVLTYGAAPEADYRVDDIRAEGFSTAFTLTVAGGEPLRCTVPVPGRHNVLNAAAALAVAGELGHSPVAAARGLADFTGAGRRFELKGRAGGVEVYDSYAHHPTEISADLWAARAALDSRDGGAPPHGTAGRVVAMFQPHLYSRTRIFADEFAEALSLADEVVVLPIYAAREDREPGVDAGLVTRAIGHGRVHDERDRDAAVHRAASLARPGDIVLTMGAGDITELGPRIVAALGATTE